MFSFMVEPEISGGTCGVCVLSAGRGIYFRWAFFGKQKHLLCILVEVTGWRGKRELLESGNEISSGPLEAASVSPSIASGRSGFRVWTGPFG